MGDLNQLDFVIENRHLGVGPILEIGSKDYGNTNNFRTLFPNELYLGIDQEGGKGVDVVCDFTSDHESLKRLIGVGQFGTVICFSVLEHCKYPFKIAENISKFLAEGGILFLSVPFVWNIHAYPDDYWRFTPASIQVLFPQFKVVEDKSFYFTKIRGERLPLTHNLKQWQRLTFRSSILTRMVQRFCPAEPVYPYTMIPVNINAVLVKTSR